MTHKSDRRYYRKYKCSLFICNIGGSNLIFSRNKRWISVGFFAVVAATCVIAPQTAKADVKIEPDGVMGQSVVDETHANTFS